MDRSLFRRKALAARQQEWFAPVSITTPVSAAVLSLTAISLLGLLVLAVSLIEVPDKVQVSGILMPRTSFVEVRAPRAGRLRRLYVSDDAVVGQGQALLVIDSTTIAPGRDAVSVEQIDSLERELGFLDQSLHQGLAEIDRRVESNRDRRALLKERLQLLINERDLHGRVAGIQAGAASRVSRLVTASAVSRQQADEYRVAAIRAQLAEHGLAREIAELEADIELLDRQLRDEQAASEQLKTTVAMRSEALRREISRQRADASLEIAATVSGQVAGMSLREGSYVQAGELLLTLLQPTSPIEARLYVPASQAGRVRPGQEVRLKLDAFPEQLFGAQVATISAVSPLALPARDLGLPLSLPGLVFEARAETLASDSLAARLPPGTVVRADIVRYRWPLLKWLFSSRRGPSV